jgi:hypothetical protein
LVPPEERSEGVNLIQDGTTGRKKPAGENGLKEDQKE